MPMLKADTAHQVPSSTRNPHCEPSHALAARASEPMTLAARYKRDALLASPNWLAVKAARITAEPKA